MAKKVKKKELGLGIRALLSNIDESSQQAEEKKEKIVKELSDSVAMIPINQIQANPEQPRSQFEEEPLQELVASIKIHGLIQPLTLRRLSADKYQIISGERRFRASQRAGLTEVPAYIRLANDQEMLEMALIENIQREDLNPIEIAITYGRLKKEFELTDQQLAERVGKGRATITHYLGVMSLPEEIIQALRNRQLTMGHAKALMNIEDKALLISLCRRIIDEKMSVRQIESLAAALKGNKKKHTKKTKKTNLPDEYQHIQNNLRSHFGSKVMLKLDGKKEGKGQITISFEDTNDLNRILDLLDT